MYEGSFFHCITGIQTDCNACLPFQVPIEELKRFSEQIVKGLMLRQRYMKASLQVFHKPTAKQLKSVHVNRFCNLFEEFDGSDENILLKKKSIAGKLSTNIALNQLFLEGR